MDEYMDPHDVVKREHLFLHLFCYIQEYIFRKGVRRAVNVRLSCSASRLQVDYLTCSFICSSMRDDSKNR